MPSPNLVTPDREINEKPILFTGPMVRAILEDRKTQTRRIVKPQPPKNCDEPLFDKTGHGWFYDGLDIDGNCFDVFPDDDMGIRCPYGQPGDHLWVRETHYLYPVGIEREGKRETACVYRADGELPQVDRWRPSIHMPRWASRIQLEITDVRVEQVQDITAREAIAEGIVHDTSIETYWGLPLPVVAFAELWDEINADRGFPWVDNPWVWVVSFRRVLS